METATATESSAPHFQRFVEVFKCPACGGELAAGAEALSCKSSAENGCPTYAVENGIPRLFVENEWDAAKSDVTTAVKAFYEKTPFPNYDDTDSVSALIQKSRRGLFARLLDEQVPLGIKVLEAGCGTGQLTNFLGIAQRDVFGTDMCLHSLALAEDFRRNNSLANVGLYQMNLFRPFFQDESFDLVITNGVLHHTSDPYGAFRSLTPLVKTGGYIIVGLYNRYGRLMTDLRRRIFALTGRRFLFLDPYLKERRKLDAKTEAWFADQYQHPHESKHTMGEVLSWFEETGFDFINSIPKNTFMSAFSEDEKLFAVTPKADALTLAAVQAHMIGTGNREGGLFIMIGKRR